MSALQKILCLLIITFCLCSKLAESFQKCNRKQADFSECLTKAFENTLRQLKEPIEEYDGLCLEPLEIPPFSVTAKNKTAAFIQDYKSYKMYGFSVANCAKVEMDFVTKNLAIECTFPKITIMAEYHFDGKLHDLKFNASGAGTEVMKNLKINLLLILGEYEKDGQIHYRVIKHKFEVEPESLESIDLGNIVDGDSLQSNKVNQAFNDNWELILEDVKTDYEKPIGNHIATIFNNFLEKVPVSEIFDNDYYYY